MKKKNEVQRKIYLLKSRPIVSLVIGLSVLSAILIITMFNSAAGSEYFGNSLQTGIDSTNNTSDSKLFGVVKKIDEERKLITIFDIRSQEDATLYYTGGTQILDKYGEQMLISKLSDGVIVDAGYNKEDSKLIKVQISKKSWEYTGVCDLIINKTEKFMKAANSKYKYNEYLSVFDQDTIISVDNLAGQDVLTLRGYKETVWSVSVDKGHGTVRLENYNDFLGGNITVGYEEMQQITKDTAITVREGNVNLTVDNGEFTATKNITVMQNEETLVSLDNLGPDGVKLSKVTFDITPFGADLFIDGRLTSYANPIKLPYGGHSIKVSLDDYITYERYITVDEAGKTFKIVLPKAENNNNTDSVDKKNSDTSDNSDSTDTSEPEDNTDTTNTSDAADNEDSTEVPNTSNNSSNTDDTVQKDNSDTKKSVDKNHKIYIQNPEGASVYLDGDYMGTSPGSFKKITGSHVLTFIKKGYTTKSYTVEVMNDGKDTYFSLPNLVKSTKK